MFKKANAPMPIDKAGKETPIEKAYIPNENKVSERTCSLFETSITGKNAIPTMSTAIKNKYTVCILCIINL